MKSLKFSLVTPERKLLEEDVVQATLPTEAGEVTILPDHIPYIATLKPGEVITKNAKGELKNIVVLGGFVEFHDNTLSILADAAEHASEVDIARAEAAVARAREIREEKLDVSAEEREAAVAALERAWARLHVAKKHKSRGGMHPETGV